MPSPRRWTATVSGWERTNVEHGRREPSGLARAVIARAARRAPAHRGPPARRSATTPSGWAGSRPPPSPGGAVSRCARASAVPALLPWCAAGPKVSNGVGISTGAPSSVISVTSTARAAVVVAAGVRVRDVALPRHELPHRPLDVERSVAVPGLQPEALGLEASARPGPAGRPPPGAAGTVHPRGTPPCRGSCPRSRTAAPPPGPGRGSRASTRSPGVPASAPTRSHREGEEKRAHHVAYGVGSGTPAARKPSRRMRQLSQRPQARPAGSGS